MVKNRNLEKIARRILTLIILILVIAWIYYWSKPPREEGDIPQSPPITAEKTRDVVGQSKEEFPCENISSDMVANIAEGLTVSGGGRLRDAKAIKSKQRSNVYYISAEIDGPGMWGNGEIGTWITNTLKPIEFEYRTSTALQSYRGNGLPHNNVGGIIMAAPGLAEEFSDWRQGWIVSWRRALRSSDPELQASIECVRKAQGK